MDESAAERRLDFEQFRGYLLLLARTHLHARHQRRLDPSDIVQQTLLEAHQTQAQHHGRSDAETAQWLRRILVHNVADAVRSMGAMKRDIAREQSLEAAMDGANPALDGRLLIDETSAGQRLAKAEDLLRLAQHIAKLPDRQREAVVLHHLEGISVAATAEHLACSEGAAASLLHRGLKQLQLLMQAPE